MAGFERWDEAIVAQALAGGGGAGGGDALDRVDGSGVTPLWHAVYFGQPAWVARLLAAGARVDAHDPARIDRAGGSGHVVTLWSNVGATVSAPTGPSTLLHVAAAGHGDGAREVATQLLAHGLAVDARDAFGDTPLHVAAWTGHAEIVELLLAAGADPRANDLAGYHPIDHGWHRVEVLELLLAGGASPEGGPRPRHEGLVAYVAGSGRADALAILLAAGGDVVRGRGAAAIASAGWRGHATCIELLLAAGASVDATIDWRGAARAALPAAAMYASRACCELLIERCAHQVDDALATAIELSSDDYPSAPNDRSGARRELVGWLIDHGADPTRALLRACGAADGSYACVLVERGAKLDVVDAAGDGVLVHAARRGHRALAELVLARGADAKSRAADGATAYQVAERAYKRDKIDDARFVMAAISAAGGGPAQVAPPAAAAAAKPGVGARVTHATFGDGSITKIAGDKWTVKFDSAGIKTLQAKFLRSAPARPK